MPINHQPRPLRRRALLLALSVFLGLTLAGSARAVVCDTTVNDLEAGVPVTGLARDGACPAGPFFKIVIPERTTHLVISTMGGTGDADLYVKLGAPPTSQTSADYTSTEPGNLEIVSIANPPAGTWYLQVFPHATFSGVTLSADFAADETPVADGVPVSNLADAQAQGVQYFSITVPPGAANLSIETSGGTGNVDLLVRRGFLPTQAFADVASRGSSNVERIDIPSPQGGVYKVAMLATAPYSGVTLVMTVTPVGGCAAGPTDLCLLGNRFRVEVSFLNQHSGNAPGVGKPLPGTDQTGYFWFFNQENTELVVKMVDGRSFNGRFWVFHGGLSDVDYTITVTDTVTNAKRTYRNLPGTLSSGADTSAF
jgi:hypothetical protein